MTLGFSIVRTFLSSVANQNLIASSLVRPYPQTIVSDLWDFALGIGWMSALLFVMSAWAVEDRDGASERGFVRIALAQVVTLAVLALLAGETARLWIFLFPFAAYATGRELVRWSFNQRLAFFSVAFLNVATVAQNMAFFALAPR